MRPKFASKRCGDTLESTSPEIDTQTYGSSNQNKLWRGTRRGTVARESYAECLSSCFTLFHVPSITTMDRIGRSSSPSAAMPPAFSEGSAPEQNNPLESRARRCWSMKLIEQNEAASQCLTPAHDIARRRDAIAADDAWECSRESQALSGRADLGPRRRRRRPRRRASRATAPGTRPR